MRKRLSKLRFRLKWWLKTHRRGILLTFWFLLFTVLGGAYYLLSQYYSIPIINPLGLLNGDSLIALSDPVRKDVPHSITGVFYSNEEAEPWKSHRPLAVMIDNHRLARPSQFGLQKADVIYEAVAEGGITRFLAVFHSQKVGKLGPVRSARVYYMGWALEFPAYYIHVGGAATPGPANIHSYIANNNVLSLNQFRLGSPTFTFGGNVLLPGGGILSHINYTSTDKLWKAGEKIRPGTNKLPKFVQWSFKSDRPHDERSEKQEFSFNFWYLPAYKVKWQYDRKTNSYLRFQGGEKHLDQATEKQLSAKNVVLAYMTERNAGDGTSHRLFTITGKGDVVLYRDGKKIEGTWERSSLSSRMRFFERGAKKELKFNRGLTWIEIVSK